MNNTVTWSEARMLVGFGTIILSIAAAWFNLASMLATTQQKVDFISQSQQEERLKLSSLQTLEQTDSQNIAQIKQRLNDAGVSITRVTTPTSGTSATLTAPLLARANPVSPTPTPVPQTIINNNVIQTQPTSQPTPIAVTPVPTQSPLIKITLPILNSISI